MFQYAKSGLSTDGIGGWSLRVVFTSIYKSIVRDYTGETGTDIVNRFRFSSYRRVIARYHRVIYASNLESYLANRVRYPDTRFNSSRVAQWEEML